jgi:hypothetical protein
VIIGNNVTMDVIDVFDGRIGTIGMDGINRMVLADVIIGNNVTMDVIDAHDGINGMFGMNVMDGAIGIIVTMDGLNGIFVLIPMGGAIGIIVTSTMDVIEVTNVKDGMDAIVKMNVIDMTFIMDIINIIR